MESSAPGWIWRMRLTLVFWLSSALVPAQAQKFKVLHTFKGSDGDGPATQLVRDKAGNLYGTTIVGGSSKCPTGGCGTVFKMDKTGKLVWSHKFQGANGDEPFSGLLRDAAGNLYGTTTYGGKINNHVCSLGCGVVFKLDGSGKETVLHKFNGVNGSFPVGPLVADRADNLYGVTQNSNNGSGNAGTVFKLDKTGKEAILHNFGFGCGTDGCDPDVGVILDAAGNIYGATFIGGDLNCNPGQGCGVVFKLDTNGVETVLHTFERSDGAGPSSPLLMDATGNLYGMASGGGNLNCQGGLGCGVVYKLSPNSNGTWSETVLYTFCSQSNCIDGKFPGGGALVHDATGNLYGTAIEGGANAGCSGGNGCGVVFKLDTSGTETVLHNFAGKTDGNNPDGVTIDRTGKLYGTATSGGDTACNPPLGCGVVFKITP